MATAEQIAALRLLINEPTEDTYTDEQLNAFLDAVEGDGNAVARDIWAAKASKLSTFVNVSESGSSRSMGDLYKNALALSKFYSDKVDVVEDVPVVVRAQTRAIERL